MSQSPGRLLPGDHVLSSGRPLSQGRNGHRDSLPSPPGSGFQIHETPDNPQVYTLSQTSSRFQSLKSPQHFYMVSEKIITRQVTL